MLSSRPRSCTSFGPASGMALTMSFRLADFCSVPYGSSGMGCHERHHVDIVIASEQKGADELQPNQ